MYRNFSETGKGLGVMYQVGERIIYGIHGICTITALESRTVGKDIVLYYVLEPKDNGGSQFYVPVHNQAAVSKLRKLLTRQELSDLLSSPAAREDAWISDESQRKQLYRDLIKSGDRAALVSMLGCLYRHRQNCIDAGRKFHISDENFLRDAEKLIRSEFAEVLDIPPEQVGDYIRNAMR